MNILVCTPGTVIRNVITDVLGTFTFGIRAVSVIREEKREESKRARAEREPAERGRERERIRQT